MIQQLRRLAINKRQLFGNSDYSAGLPDIYKVRLEYSLWVYVLSYLTRQQRFVGAFHPA